MQIKENARIVYLVFELTMPGRGSWNNKWSGERDKHYNICKVPYSLYKERYSDFDGKDWWYNWGDGWVASISCETVDSQHINGYRKANAGFCGYDWMVQSIMKDGTITKPKRV